MKKLVLSSVCMLSAALFASELVFPDGSKCEVDKLPGELISGNSGVYGDYYRPAAMNHIKLGMLFDGEARTRLLVWADRGTKKYPVEFPDTATVSELQIIYSAAKESNLLLFVSNDGKTWQKHHSCDLPVADKKFLRIPVKPVTARFFAFGNAGKIKHELWEVWFWGKGKMQPLAEKSGVLPEMKQFGSRQVALPVLNNELTAKNFTPEVIKDFKKLDLSVLRQSNLDERASLFGAMTPQGIVIIHRRNDPKFRLSHYEVACNRTDLIMNRYYYFIGYSTGASRTDSSRVIDPTESGREFKCQSFRKKLGDIYYDVMILPIGTMTKTGNFNEYQWAFSFVGLYLDENRKPIRLTFPAIRSLHVPLQFGVVDALKKDGEKSSMYSFEGMDHTVFSQKKFDAWRNLPAVKGKSLAISRANLETGVVYGPVLPEKDLNKDIRIRMTRTEIENIFLFTVNPQDKNIKAVCRFEGFKDAKGNPASGISAETGAVGVTSLRSGTVLRPVFTPDNMPGKVFFNKYIRNASSIENFPELSLAPGGAAALTLRVRSDNASPGKYQGVFRIGNEKINIIVDVLDILLERPQEIWNNGHAKLSSPDALIKGKDYAVREAQYFYDCGINVFPINPLKNPRGVAELKQRIPNLLLYFRNYARFNTELLRGRVNPKTWNKQLADEIIKEVKTLRDNMLAAGWTRRQFFISLKDEPGVDNTAWGYGKIVELLKKFDPELQLYCNPCCWTKGGFASAVEIEKAYSSWYHMVDISYPHDGLYFGWGNLDVKPLRKLWNAPRRFNGTYIHPYPGRVQPWKAFFAGLNAWGYYSMYQPMTDAWNDFDRGSMDYQTLYPGVNAPIYTLNSEQTREAWDDYLMLLALKKHKNGAGVLKKLEKSMKDSKLFPTVGIQSIWDARREAMLNTLAK